MLPKKSVDDPKLAVVWVREEPGNVVHLVGVIPSVRDVGTSVCQQHFALREADSPATVSLPVGSSALRGTRLEGAHVITCIACNAVINRCLAELMVRDDDA